MLINKIYPTISGEVGVVIPQGSPCLLVRTQQCNLKCWYCDAKETQSSEGGTYYSVVNIITMAVGKNLPILLTGGEPLLQSDCNDLITICFYLNIPIQIETNGTIKLPDNTSANCGIIADYKVGQTFVFDLNSDLGMYDYVKFIVKDIDDLKEVCSIIMDNKESTVNWAISPIQLANELIHKNITAKEISEFIIKNKIPAVLNIQLHKLIGIP